MSAAAASPKKRVLRKHDMPFGAEILETGQTRFRLWAPDSEDVQLELTEKQIRLPMTRQNDGWVECLREDCPAGTTYRYVIGGELAVPDPASRFQPDDIDGPSQVVDPKTYEWQDEQWRGRPWEEAIIYELHVGTFTPEGTFEAARKHLGELKALGITCVEIMPVADFPGTRGWGYDGVLLFAPEASYGMPDAFKAFIDEAHRLGLMVMLDVVYNHFGPSGNYLYAYASRFFTDRYSTPWGDAVNYDGEDSATIRDFIIHNALYWLEEYHLDGLRLDAVHAIKDNSPRHILSELQARAREAFADTRHIHLVLENVDNEAKWLGQGSYRAQWNDDIHHCWHRLLTGEASGYYADYDNPRDLLRRCLAEGFAFQGENSAFFGNKPRGEKSDHLPPSCMIAFTQNHDQIGNRAFGERLDDLADPAAIRLSMATLLLSPQIPMLFMGQEWSARTPFLYFCDFTDESLAQSVREGRREEFSHFPEFSSPEKREAIPDPSSLKTFNLSCLDWQAQDRTFWENTHQLLAIRHANVMPLLKTGWKHTESGTAEAGGLWVCWHFAGGTLSLRANYANEPCATLPRFDGNRLWGDDRQELKPWGGEIRIDLS